MQYKQRHFNFALARNADSITSHMAADKLNKGDALPMQQLEVLRALSTHNGVTAKKLGEVMAYHGHDRYEWPRKRMVQLIGKGFVERNLVEGENSLRCWITNKGLEYLKR